MLKSIRDSGKHKELGMTWKEFCEKELGVSKPFADHQIHCIEEYGVDYFRVAEIVPLSEGTYNRSMTAAFRWRANPSPSPARIASESRRQ
jgi:hypothetical protein